MSLALFDLDNTLIAGDSSQSFCEFLAASVLPTPHDFLQVNSAYMRDYDEGRLDLADYMRYTLLPLLSLNTEEIKKVVDDFLDKALPEMWLPKAIALLDSHRAQGDELVVVSATGSHIVEPIAKRLNIPSVLAVDIEIRNDRPTGNIRGIPTFREGKVERVTRWLNGRDINLKEATFYSDSLNDLPLLEAVQHPVAVDPDPILEQIAQEQAWKIISLR